MRQAYDYWQDQPGNCFVSHTSRPLDRNTAQSRELRSDIEDRLTQRLDPPREGRPKTGRVECRLRGPTCVTPPKGGDSLVFYVASHCNEAIIQSNRLWSGTLPQPTFRRLVLGVSNPSHNLSSTSSKAGSGRGGRTHE